MNIDQKKYRLLTRSDFDGLVCALLLKDLGSLESIKFVHPKDVQDGTIEVTENDILTNLPYVPSCHLCFDHHASEELRNGRSSPRNYILKSGASSAARVLYTYYGGRETFPEISESMLDAVDKADSANFTLEDVLNPQGWVLLSLLMDPRTGLGRFREFRVSNYQLMMQLIDYCREHTIEETLNLPDVRERVDLYREHHDRFTNQIRKCTRLHGSVAVLDLRGEDIIFCGNRFMIYALFPQCNLSIHVLWGLNKQNTVIAVGRSILNRTSRIRVGNLLLTYEGGGHDGAGACQIANHLADQVLSEIINVINSETSCLKEPVTA
jgi:nanoRNase/pAp phosphatase (c-di-AMP/oligoRNAs hydrolase)